MTFVMKISPTRVLVTMTTIAAVCSAGPLGAKTTLVVPGMAIGAIRLGSDGAETLRHLPKPYASDNGMSQTRQVWKFTEPGGLFDILFIHTTVNGVIDAQPPNGITIDLIRTTAKRYLTVQGVSVGSTLSQIQKIFPDAAPVQNSPAVFDAVKEGIAFEFDRSPDATSRCIALMVHFPGQSRVATKKEVAAVLEERSKK
jgi:hypothetical protein